MASNYPSGLDSFTNPAGTDNLSAGIGHAAQHANANDAIEAIESTLGLNPQGASATVKARLDAIEAASAAIDVSKLSGVVTSAGVGNLLTTNQASIETDTTGWAAGANSTIARTTATALSGSACLEITCTGAGDASVATPTASSATVTPGRTYTGVVSLKAATTGRFSSLIISWYTSGSAYISSTTSSTATTSTSAWATIYTTGVAPATAAYARLVATVGAPGASEVHYLDCAGVWQGAGGLWSLPGTPIANLGTYTDESVGRRIFTWDTVNSRWNLTWGDTGWRNISSLVGALGTRTVTNIRCRRVLNTVHFMQQIADTQTNPSAQSLVTMPSGFGSASTKWFTMGSSSVNIRQLGVFSDSTVVYTGPTDANRYDTEVSWLTTDAWPTALPGTAFGSIPT